MLPIWLDPDGDLKQVTRDKIQKLSNSEDSVVSQHPYWKGEFSIDDVTDEDLESISSACLDNDDKLKALFNRLVPNAISNTTFWTSYLSHVEYCLMTDKEGENGLELEVGTVPPAASESKGRKEEPVAPMAPNASGDKSETTLENLDPSSTSSSVTPSERLQRGVNAAVKTLCSETQNGKTEAIKINGPVTEKDHRTLCKASTQNQSNAQSIIPESIPSTTKNGKDGNIQAAESGGGVDNLVDTFLDKRMEGKQKAEMMKVAKPKRNSSIPASTTSSSQSTTVYCPFRATTGWVAVWKAGVYVRKNPDIEALAIGFIPYGDAVAAIERKGTWIRHRLGWSCVKIGTFTLLEEVPQVSTPYGPAFLCHHDSNGSSKAILAAFGAEAYLMRHHVKLVRNVADESAANNANSISKLVHHAKSIEMEKNKETNVGHEDNDTHTGLVVGIMQLIGAVDEI